MLQRPPGFGCVGLLGLVHGRDDTGECFGAPVILIRRCIDLPNKKRWNVRLVSVSTSEFRSAHQAARLKLDRLVLCHSPYACTMVCRRVPLGWWTLAQPSSTGRLSPWLSVCTALSLGSSFLLAATTHKKWGVLIEKSFSESYTSEYHQTR